MARKLSAYDWQQKFTDEAWVLRINDTHSFEVAFCGRDILGKEMFSFAVVDFLGRRGTVLYDCCLDCAKWKCIGLLEGNNWQKYMPNKETP